MRFCVSFEFEVADSFFFGRSSPDCDGVHGPKNPLKKGEHDKNWEEGPPPPEVEDAGGDGGGGGGDGGGEGEGEGGGDGGGDGGGGGEGGE